MPPTALKMKRPARANPLFAGTVSLGHAARVWGVPRRQVRRALAEGRTPFVQIAGKLRIPADAVAEAKP